MNSPKQQNIKSTQKKWLHFYILTKQSEKEIIKTIQFTITSKRIKHLGINLTKQRKHLYHENYKALLKEIKEDINKWKHISCSWIVRLHIVETSILKVIFRFNAIPIKSPMNFLWGLLKKQKNDPRVHMESQKTLKIKTILTRKNKT